MLTRQLPAYSPLTARAVLNGWRELASDHSSHVCESVREVIAEGFATREVLLTDSGTTALGLAIEAMLAERHERVVALPAYSCYEVASAAELAGASVLLYDVDPKTMGPDLDSLTRVLDDGAGVVVVAHLFGFPTSVAHIQQICARAGAAVIEDAAQGGGGRLHGRPLGSFGSAAVLSFGRGKGVTGGRCGALLAHDAVGTAVVERARHRLGPADTGLAVMSALTAQWLLARPALYGIPASMPFLKLGQTVYRPAGRPRRPADACCGVLGVTLSLSAAELGVRRRNAERLLALGRNVSGVIALEPVEGAEPGYLRLPMIGCASAAGNPSARRLGVMPGYPQTLGSLDGFSSLVRNRRGEFPGADELAAALVTLPTHSRLTEPDLVALEAWLAALPAVGA